jgi:hypothetical protein
MSLNDDLIETPFAYRHHCWFCGEPAAHYFSFPHSEHLTFDCPHPHLTLPSCIECARSAIKAKANSIWQVEQYVKKYLVTKYRKDLAIGINWTQEELANSEFEGGSFEGFQRSAWLMYEIAKQRVNFSGWPLSVNGIDLDNDDTKIEFIFDGVFYPSINDAIEHYAYSFHLDSHFIKRVLAKLGTENFANAVRFCRLHIGATPDEKAKALRLL